MSARGTKRRSARQVADRRQSRSIYYEPDSEEDDFQQSEDEDFALELQPATKKRKTRPTKPQTRAAAQSRRSALKPRRAKAKAPEKKKKHSRKLGAPLKPKTAPKEARYTGPSDNRIPDWTSLPIEILRDIFTFASKMVHEEQTLSPSAYVNWLMRTARVCRAFAAPALEAYYQAPALLNTMHPHYLLELLRMPQDKTYLHFAVKVRSLNIDVKQLSYTATGRERFDLSTLVRLLPQLQDLEVIHPASAPPFRNLTTQRWRYPGDLFQALDESGARLKSWRWTSDLIPISAIDTPTYMSIAHTSKPFESLQRLFLCGFEGFTRIDDVMEPDHDKVPWLVGPICQLPNLKELVFVSCDLVVNKFLEHMPKRLERLELSNCLELTSDMLRSYMATGGSQLRELILNHNSAVDLTFLPGLKMLCPKLEVLKMDLTYYSERTNYNDAWAMYDHLLGEDDVPTWPSTMRHIELVNLQKWEAKAAQNLFRSLVDGAKDLPDLRHLVIHAHISIPWRDRAQFRDQWIDRLNTVYLRKNEDPNPFFGSLRQFKLYKEAIANGRSVVSPVDLDTDEEPSTRRRLSHVRITPRKAPEHAKRFADTEPTPEKSDRTSRRSARVATRTESLNASTAGEDESTSEDDEDSEEWSKQPELFVQGLCRIVDIRIDNQRPAENQYTEANFLDSEPSGDEDWHSGAEEADDGYAW